MTEPQDHAARRRKIPPSIEAALWALSNGQCYAPGCTSPVVLEVRRGVYKKNAQIAHIVAVKPGAPRYQPCRTREEERKRDSFSNLLLLCLAHHAEIDDKNYGDRLYPATTLLKWKQTHEGRHGPQLAGLGPLSEEILAEALTSVFTPPTARLEKIADQLERTGTLNSEALAELRDIINIMEESPGGTDSSTARDLAFAADVFSSYDIKSAASSLMHASDVLPSLLSELDTKISRLYDLM